MLSDDDFDTLHKSSILDTEGVDLHQDVGTDNISQPKASARFFNAIAISLAFHAIILIAIVLWWMQLPDRPVDNMTQLFQVSISPAVSNNVSSTPAPASSQEATENIPQALEIDEQVLIEQEDPATKENNTEQLLSQGETEIILEKQEVEKDDIGLAQNKSIVDEDIPSQARTSGEREVVLVSNPDVQKLKKITSKNVNNSLSKSTPIETGERKMIEEKLRKFIAERKNTKSRSTSLSWQEKGVSYQATITKKDLSNVMELESLAVNLKRIQNEQEMSTDIQYKRLAFSNYAQIVNRWDDDVYISEDVFEGRFHSNSSINIDTGRKFESIFLGKVTIATFRNPPRKYRSSETFKAGLELGAEKITLPKGVSPLDGVMSPEDEQIHYFDEDSSIRFLADGAYEWSISESNNWTRSRAIEFDTIYLLAKKGVRLSVQGEVSGKVIVYSPERITIVGNIVYSKDPRVFPESNDYLGLVSEKNVEIAGPKVTGEGDLEIHAAIYAKRRFSVRRYRVRTNAMMTILGSVSAGSLSATEPRFATQIRFDKRLEDNRPPLFPITDQYEINHWNAVWQ